MMATNSDDLPTQQYPEIEQVVPSVAQQQYEKEAATASGGGGGGGTLIDQIDQRKAEIEKEKARSKAKYNKSKSTGNGSDSDEDYDSDATEGDPAHDFDDLENPMKDIPTWMLALIYSVALSAIYGLFETLVNQQYSIEITFSELLVKMATVLPAMAIVVYFTQILSKYSPRIANPILLALATTCGCYFIHLNLHSPRLGIMKRAPGLVTIWIYLSIVMEVRPAIINVLVVCFCFGYLILLKLLLIRSILLFPDVPLINLRICFCLGILL